MMLVVFAGGGTGGHLYPGIAVTESLGRICDGCEFEFWGTGRPVERRVLEGEGLRREVLASAPLPRRLTAVGKFAWAQIAGYRQARRLLKGRGAKVVVGLGGYSSFAPVLAARHLGLKTVILEQNVSMGRANRYLARKATLVCLSWEESAKSAGGKMRAEVTGNPLRRALVEAAMRSEYSAMGGILVLGGSTGAVGLNSMVLEAVKALGETGRQVTHQTGETDFERVRRGYEEAGVEARVVPFIEDMAGAYRGAGLLVGRAGGTTLSEAAIFGIPGVLVPYPHHKDHHQTANAEVFARAEAAEIIEEGEGAGERLSEMVGDFCGKPTRLENMHAASLALGRPQAAGTIAERISGMLSDERKP